MGEYSDKVVWSEDGLKACNKFLNKIWNIQELVTDADTKELQFSINTAIKKVSNDIDNNKFNTAISAIMILVNEIYKLKKISNEDYKKLILLISPFAPHLANELFEIMGYGKSIETAEWPQVDENALKLDEIEMPVQINGRVRSVITIPSSATQEEIVEIAKSNEEVAKFITGNIVKVIYVPGKILNLIVK